MPTVLVASDAEWVRNEIRSCLVGPGFAVIEVSRGQDVRNIVALEHPDLVIADMQIANMGGVAVTIDLRLEEYEGRLGHVPVLLLIDREADRFLAHRSGADAMLAKPVDAGTLRRAVRTLLAQETSELPGVPS